MLKAARWMVVSMLMVVAVVLSFVLGYAFNEGGGEPLGAQTSAAQEGQFDFSVLNQIHDILTDDYVDPDRLDDETLYESAISGLLAPLSDSGTFYVDPTTYQVSVGPGGTFEGIGATVSQQGSEIVIVAPISDTPAERAGLRSGDVILGVDGESTEGWSVDKAVLKIRGPRGTDVTLTIRHPDGQVEDVTITRDEIRVESVSVVPPGGVLEDAEGNPVTDIAYIRIREFTALTREQLQPLLEEIRRSGKRGLILDLRANPGGLLSTTVDVANMFLDSGIILFEVDKEGEELAFNARPGGEGVDIPLVVLVDRFSASGAEVLAAALKDNGRAALIGEKTFGKGSVNVSRNLDDGGALFVSIARWLTPDRIQIDGVGIRPDIEAVLSDEDIDLRRDSQLHRAVEHMRGLSETVSQEAGTSP
ncbi:MAG: S41 family peptidase [Dehalococcoidia bacterium]